MIVVALSLLAVAATGFVTRLIVGPSVADRLVATDGLLVLVICALAIQSARTSSGFYVDAAIVIGLLGFVGTGVAAHLVDRQGG